MASGIVYEGVIPARQPDTNDAATSQATPDKLFTGLRLWFSYSVPQRTWFIENAEANGAQVVPLEKQADIRLVDHTRKNNAPGTHSYRFVEASIRNCQLEDLIAHRVGTTASVNRPVGSVVTGPKGTRNPFTEAEDQFLWNVITPFKEKGGSWKGNEIYKQIARARPTHTFQSWRDRYLKKVVYHDRTVTEHVSIAAEFADQAETSAIPQPTASSSSMPPPSTKQDVLRKRQRLEDEAGEITGSAEPDQQQRSEASSRVSPDKRPRLSNEIDGAPTQPGLDQRAAPSPPKRATLTASTQQQVDGPHPPLPQRQTPDVSGRQMGSVPISKQQTPSPRKAQNLERKQSPQTPNPLRPKDAPPHHSPRTPRSPTKGPHPDEYPEKYPHNFTRFNYRTLFRITSAILETDKDLLVTAFNNVAAEFPEVGHTGRDWRLFWQQMVLPRYCKQFGIDMKMLDPEASIPNVWSMRTSRSPAKIPGQMHQKTVTSDREEVIAQECAHCLTKKSSRWRRDRSGEILCNDCGRLMKESRLRSMSGNFSAVPDEVDESATGEEQLDNPIQKDATATATATPAQAHRSSLPPVPSFADSPAPPATPSAAPRFAGYSDAGVQTSPIISPQRVREDIANDSLSQQGELRPPEPNEARKRRAGCGSQSTSQETAKSHDNSLKAELAALVTEDVESVEIEPQQRRYRTPRLSPVREKRKHPSPKVLEIPSTPEHTSDAQSHPAADGRSFHSMASQLQASRRSSSPLFVPEDESGDEQPHLPTDGQGSSPLKIKLLDESSRKEFSSQRDGRKEYPQSEADYDFHTAPNMSQEWDTAPESPSRYRRQSTQALFDRPIEQGFNLDLPEPEGGWEELGISESTLSEFNGEMLDEDGDVEAHPDVNADDEMEVIDLTFDEEDVDPSESASQTGRSRRNVITTPPDIAVPSSPPLRSNKAKAPAKEAAMDSQTNDYDIDIWLEQQRNLYQPPLVRPGVLEEILSAAIDAACFDYDLAASVIRTMIASSKTAQGREMRLQRRWAALVPDDYKGVWTEDDDLALDDQLGYKESKRVLRKHGEAGCQARREFLRAQAEA